MAQKIEEVIVIGAGPAGVASAVQLGRLGVTPLVIERRSVGGLLANALLVENYCGFPDGVAGGELCRLLSEHLSRSGANVFHDEVISADVRGPAFRVRTRGGEAACRALIIATGTKPKPFTDVAFGQDVEPFVKYDVSELSDLEGKTIIIVGAGDVAFDYALNLNRRNRAIIVYRGVKPRALAVLQERARAAGVACRPRTTISGAAASGSGRLNLETNAGVMEADVLLVAIGREPVDDFVTEGLSRAGDRLARSGALYFAGDVHNGDVRQVAVAAGDGVRAAFAVARYLNGD